MTFISKVCDERNEKEIYITYFGKDDEKSRSAYQDDFVITEDLVFLSFIRYKFSHI